MKFAASIALAAFGTYSLAQTVQSAPFNLTVTSIDGKYSDATLAACHEGAGIEALCVGVGSSTFNHNTTSGEEAGPGGLSGPLTYYLNAEPTGESEPMYFYIDPSTNVALPLFSPGTESQNVAFDSNNLMNVQTNYNDKVTPPTSSSTETVYYRWFVCETNFEGYVYETLSWLYGDAAPQNPSCVSVSVTKVDI